MSSTWMLTLIFVVPPPDQPLVSRVAAGDETAAAVETTTVVGGRPRTKGELREAYRAAIRKTSFRQEFEMKTVVPEVVMLYGEIAQAPDMAHTEKARMHGGLKVRLEQLRDRLVRDNLRRERDHKQAARVRNRSSRTNAAADLAGGEIAAANDLINLIQTTIAPETWDVNGGKGSIYYFGLLKVLVVRQTGEVHHQLGGVLGQLRQ